MTLFIQNDVAGTGTGDTVHPANASVDLTQISNFDVGDGVHAGYGEAAPVGDLIQVTYDRSTSGPCPERLDTLVNTNFGVNADNIDIIILAVGSNFTLNDGTLMAGNGTARLPMTGGNPTASVLVIYDVEDNSGNGMCLKGKVSGDYDLSNPTGAMLYHELSHAFHEATDGLLSLVAPSACGASPEEQRAETDENDMRTQMGQPLRDETDHCGNPGNGGDCSACCVVASVATTSPYSAEVNALRQVRDGFLRRSDVGFDFFAHLHDDYYSFSPEVCRMMACSDDLLARVRGYFVEPLALCLGLIRSYTIERMDPALIGARFDAAVLASDKLRALSANDLDLASTLLVRAQAGSEALPDAGIAELAGLLDARALSSPYVAWALVDTIGIVVRALRCRLEGTHTTEIGRRLAHEFDAWGPRMPLTEVWHGLSRYAVAEELRFLGKALLRNEQARFEFKTRLFAHLGRRQDIVHVLDGAWDAEAEELVQ